ncbi:MAG: hypothetical protein IPO27_17360 [Bacteroidetes bacterium]|nr:hypothetical protein [Bacteroidota bacterium]
MTQINYKTIGFYLLCVLLSVLFIFSGYTKLFPIEYFEISLLSSKISNWAMAPYMARLMIGLEFAIGLMLLIPGKWQQYALKGSIALLVVFIIYLSILIAIYGNSGSCGCFGETIPMSPLQGILKNVGLIVMAWAALLLKPNSRIAIPNFVNILLCLCCIIITFIVNPILLNPELRNDNTQVGKPYNLSVLYQHAIYKPKVDVTKGKWLLAFFSTACAHCKLAAKTLAIIQQQNPQVKTFFIVNGDTAKVTKFLDENNCKNIPWQNFKGPKEWLQIAGPELPNILLLQNDTVVKKLEQYTLNGDKISKWFDEK